MRYWKRVDEAGKITTVENYSHNLDIEGATEISEKKFNEYIISLPPLPPEPVRDLLAELDELEARVEKMENLAGLEKPEE